MPLNPNGISSIAYDIISIFHAIFKSHKLILVLGISGAIALPIISLVSSNTKIITNIDGIEWKRNKWGLLAKYYLKYSELIAVRFSSAVISDNKAISKYIRKNYHVNSHVIAYGGDAKQKILNKIKVKNCDKNYSLTICRIEPENNVHLILDSFTFLQRYIIIIGNWSSSQYGRDLYDKYNIYENIYLSDPIYDTDLLHHYRINCEYYIHGHSAGGTNPSLVEILKYGKPIISYDCQFNRATLENLGYYFKTSNDIKYLLQNNLVKNKYNESFKYLANSKYTWEIIKNKYFHLFEKFI